MTRTELYRRYNAANELLYVGVAKDAAARFRLHSPKWAKDVARTEITVFPTRVAALAAEVEVIKLEKPKFNVVHLPPDDRRHQRSMNSEEYRDALDKIGLSQGEAAKFLGISIRSSNSYANGRLIPNYIAMFLRMMIKFNIKPEDVT